MFYFLFVGLFLFLIPPCPFGKTAFFGRSYYLGYNVRAFVFYFMHAAALHVHLYHHHCGQIETICHIHRKGRYSLGIDIFFPEKGTFLPLPPHRGWGGGGREKAIDLESRYATLAYQPFMYYRYKDVKAVKMVFKAWYW